MLSALVDIMFVLASGEARAFGTKVPTGATLGKNHHFRGVVLYNLLFCEYKKIFHRFMCTPRVHVDPPLVLA
jgi:hypothetical protein